MICRLGCFDIALFAVDKIKRDATDEKKEPKVKPKDSEKKSDKVPSGNTAGRKELYNSGRTDTKAPPPGKLASTKGTAKNSSKQQAKVPSSSSTSASATDKTSAKSAAAAAVRMQVKSTSLLKQPARMPERSDSKTKLNTAPAKQDEKSTASRNSDEKVSSSTKSVPRTAPALQVASVPATLSVQPAKTKDLLKVAGQKSSIKLTLISKVCYSQLYVDMYKHISLHARTHIHTHMDTRTDACTHACTCTHTYIYIHIHGHTHACTHARTHARTHTHTAVSYKEYLGTW